MTSGGYSIGFKELYESISAVSAKLDTMGSSHAQQIADNRARIETTEKAMRVFWDRLEKQQEASKQLVRDVDAKLEAKGQSTWQVNLAIAGSTVSVIIAIAGTIIR
jgi:hypothetical protein